MDRWLGSYLSTCHITYAFQSEFTPYSCLNIKELLARNRREIWSLSDFNWTRTRNHLVRKLTLNRLGKLVEWVAKWLSVRLRTKRLWVLVQLQSLTYLVVQKKAGSNKNFLKLGLFSFQDCISRSLNRNSKRHLKNPICFFYKETLAKWHDKPPHDF